ncbi:DUF2379 family protein [Myxococcaceae bacterium GXIMD 01537]
MSDLSEIDWAPIRELAKRVFGRGEPLELSDAVHALLGRSAQEVAISFEDAADALRSIPTATTLLREISRRIEEGGDRLMNARVRSRRSQRAGDLSGARAPIHDVLAVEVVPLYREQAEIDLNELARLEAVFESGHIDPELHAWDQVRVLARRLRQGRPPEFRDDLLDFLRRTAPSVGIIEPAPRKELETGENAQALLERIAVRIQDGEQRIRRALSRMMDRREAGDREGALQELRDVLAVEVVPLFREIAQEQLDRYDDPPISD